MFEPHAEPVQLAGEVVVAAVSNEPLAINADGAVATARYTSSTLRFPTLSSKWKTVALLAVAGTAKLAL